jgi:3-hydroxymyristoyl/3-hydroxydecanoyl-(acyl carrier protein) dehydratase
MTAATHQTTLLVAPDHAALAGHFPGRPIVPGVVLLDCVLREAEHWLGRSVHVTALPQAKFTAPLLPQERAQLQLQLDGSELRFRIARADTLIAQGALRIATESRA